MTDPDASAANREPLLAYHPVYRHLPARPLWLCRVCADSWPCPTARTLLRVEYQADRVALSIYMTGRLFDAVADLYRLHPNPGPDVAELFTRFLGWVRHPLGPAEGDR